MKRISEKDCFIWDLLKDPNYRVTRDGRVLTLFAMGCRRLTKKWREVGWVSRSRGGSKKYVRINYKRQRLYRNRIVFARFAGYLDPFLLVDHIDHNKLNDAFSNLQQICTSENIYRANAFRRRGQSAGEALSNFVLGRGGDRNWRGISGTYKKR